MTKPLLCIALVFVALVAVATVYDLQISNAVVNPELAWGIALKNYGEIPALLCVALAFIMMSVSLEVRNILAKGGLLLLNFLLASLVIWYLLMRIGHVLSGLSIQEFFSGNTNQNLWLAASLTVIAATLVLKYLAADFSQNHKLYSKITIWLSWVVFTVIQILKGAWGRVRFCSLASDHSNFSPWYWLQGDSGVSSDSFPSGHAFFGWLPLVLLLLVLNQSKLVRTLSLILLVGWGIAVASSRVAIGEHYLSDVSFSSALTILCFLLFCRCFRVQEKPG